MIRTCLVLLAVVSLIPPPVAHASADTLERYRVEVVASYPHDSSAFTQGLVYHDGFLYESTGRYGESSVRKVELKSGRVLQLRRLPDTLFGEGLAIVGDRLIQLTWRANVGLVYDLKTLDPVDRFYYQTEGWGLAYDGLHLLMSDGSSTIYLRDPTTFGLIGKISVHENGRPVSRLNELEFVNGFVYANIWQSTRIAKIDPRSGRVVAWIDLDALVPAASTGAGVLNGIAYLPEEGSFVITGKLWPRLFVVNMIKE